MNKTKEVWKPVVGYEGYYEVSNQGKIRSLDRIVTNKNGINIRMKGKMLKGSVNRSGYHTVNLCKDLSEKGKLVHRLVCFAFLGECKGKNEVNHKDGVKLNNNLCNLEWCTSKENSIHSAKTGLQKFAKGEAVDSAILKEHQVVEILKSKKRTRDLAKDYKVSDSTISDIRRGRTWVHVREKVKKEHINNGQDSNIGSKNGMSKLNDETALKIYNTNDISQSEIAKKYNLDQSTVSNIKTKKLWRHIHEKTE